MNHNFCEASKVKLGKRLNNIQTWSWNWMIFNDFTTIKSVLKYFVMISFEAFNIKTVQMFQVKIKLFSNILKLSRFVLFCSMWSQNNLQSKKCIATHTPISYHHFTPQSETCSFSSRINWWGRNHHERRAASQTTGNASIPTLLANCRESMKNKIAVKG